MSKSVEASRLSFLDRSTATGWFGEEFTTLKDRKKEIGRDLLAKMCRDLNIDPHDL
jgi:hypothetical protein